MRLFLPMLLLLSACGESVDPNESTKPAAPTAPVAPKAENTEQAAPEEIYAYNPAGKRDPFQTFLTIDSTDPKDGDAGTGPSLQRWDVERYVVRGIIFGTDSPRALIIDPEGLGHVVKIGTYVGRNWGKVTSIEDQIVTVTEEYKTPDDTLVVNPVQLRLGVGDTKK